MAGRRTVSEKHLFLLLPLLQALELDTALQQLEHASQTTAQQQTELQTQLAKPIRKLQRELEHQTTKYQHLCSKRQALLKGYHACCNLLAAPDTPTQLQQWALLRKKHLQQGFNGPAHLAKEKLLQAHITGLQAQLAVLTGTNAQ